MLFSTQLNQVFFFLWLLTFLPVGNTYLVCILLEYLSGEVCRLFPVASCLWVIRGFFHAGMSR